MERNNDADQLSKLGLEMSYGSWMVAEYKDGDFFEYYHHPFIEE
jgi:hypothetical protein